MPGLHAKITLCHRLQIFGWMWVLGHPMGWETVPCENVAVCQFMLSMPEWQLDGLDRVRIELGWIGCCRVRVLLRANYQTFRKIGHRCSTLLFSTFWTSSSGHLIPFLPCISQESALFERPVPFPVGRDYAFQRTLTSPQSRSLR